MEQSAVVVANHQSEVDMMGELREVKAKVDNAN
jgi:hypothetical protein